MKIELEIDDGVVKELKYLQHLHRQTGSNTQVMNDVDQLIKYILSAVAKGSCQPRSCEREIVQQLGLVAMHDDHLKSRDYYGETA